MGYATGTDAAAAQDTPAEPAPAANVVAETHAEAAAAAADGPADADGGGGGGMLRTRDGALQPTPCVICAVGGGGNGSARDGARSLRVVVPARRQHRFMPDRRRVRAGPADADADADEDEDDYADDADDVPVFDPCVAARTSASFGRVARASSTRLPPQPFAQRPLAGVLRMFTHSCPGLATPGGSLSGGCPL